MIQKRFSCNNCGYIPQIAPSGIWYCPKCGKKSIISKKSSRAIKRYYHKPKPVQTSRDQVISQIYDKLTYPEPNDHGYKDPYLNPSIQPIEPKKRKKIRLFFKKNETE
ncbi:MAG: hypothetical protein ACFE95_17960 [Candidatus Hodarchaeota archaeon]